MGFLTFKQWIVNIWTSKHLRTMPTSRHVISNPVSVLSSGWLCLGLSVHPSVLPSVWLLGSEGFGVSLTCRVWAVVWWHQPPPSHPPSSPSPSPSHCSPSPGRVFLCTHNVWMDYVHLQLKLLSIQLFYHIPRDSFQNLKAKMSPIL